MAFSTELFAKSHYSFLEGASTPEELVTRAKAIGYSSLGICDRNGFYGSVRAHIAAKAHALPLIHGAEVTTEKGNFPLLCKSKKGYANLCEILTQGHAQREQKEVTIAVTDLLQKNEELFLVLPTWEIEESMIPLLKDTFKDRLFFSVHQCLDGKDRFRIEKAAQLSQRHHTPVVATNLPLYHLPKAKPLQDVLTCIRHQTTLKQAGFRLHPNHHRYLKSAEQMVLLFKGYEAWLETPAQIAQQCHFSLDEIRYHYPIEWIPQGETADSYLEKLVWEGVQWRYPEGAPAAVEAQLCHELALVKQLRFSDYFLTIWDIIQFANRNHILCQGRGSAANSTICYVLGITAIDPVKMDLLFERFLSVERNEPPDIDIDFEHERREEVIQYLYQRYGRHRAAITAEVICFRRKSALREAAKVFEISLNQVEKLLTATHRESLSQLPTEKLYTILSEIPPATAKQYFSLAQQLLGYPRHLGTHVGGFVLSHEALSKNIPIEKAAMPGRTIIQWDKNDLDALGFIKVDILGLGILTAIRKTFEYLKQIYQKDYSLSKVPHDEKVYEAISRADTIGVFQIESRAQMNMLPRLKPKTFYDLVIEISIVRPGPIQGQMVHPYLRRRCGKEAITYAHPDLESILKKTLGVPLFQEQIMKMAMHVAGFTPGEADTLRRLMGTWRKQGGNGLSSMRQRFHAGLVAKGIDPSYADQVFNQIEGFAEYGFPESHAASFAILAYVTAYLKYHYPDAYLTALLNSQPMGFYQISTLVHDAKRHGVKILPVDINSSHWDHVLEKPGQVRLGLRSLKGFPHQIGKAIVTARSEKRFTSFHDAINRIKLALSPTTLTKRDLFCLAGANAFESLGWERRDALWLIQSLQLQDSHTTFTADETVRLPFESGWETISQDYHSQGVSLFSHPMAYLRKELRQGIFQSSQDLAQFSQEKKVTVAGMVICRQMPPTASGVMFLTLEDEYGFINLVVWNSVYQTYKTALITSSFLWAKGKIQKTENGGIVHVIVEKADSLLSPTRIQNSESG